MRRAKRPCPAVSGDICPICCGTQREVTLSCPLDCEYLKEAHRREKANAEIAFAFPEINVKEDDVRRDPELLIFSTYSLLQASLQTEGAVDRDLLAGLAAVIQTRMTLRSGLIYESRPADLVAANIQRLLAESIDNYLEEREKDDPLHPVRDSELLEVLVFLHRIGQQHLNERPRGRRFIGVLQKATPDSTETVQPSLLI